MTVVCVLIVNVVIVIYSQRVSLVCFFLLVSVRLCEILFVCVFVCVMSMFVHVSHHCACASLCVSICAHQCMAVVTVHVLSVSTHVCRLRRHWRPYSSGWSTLKKTEEPSHWLWTQGTNIPVPWPPRTAAATPTRRSNQKWPVCYSKEASWGPASPPWLTCRSPPTLSPIITPTTICSTPSLCRQQPRLWRRQRPCPVITTATCIC